MVVKWGFCCAGKVANDVSLAMQTILHLGHEKNAIAARELSKAEEFSKLHSFKKFYGSYVELARDTEVDIVYISSLHPQHYELTKLFLENNKHVLCEKPLSTNLEHTTMLSNLAKSRNLFLMEGLWSRFFPVYQKIKELINDGEIGDVKHIQANFFYPNPTERQLSGQLGGSVWLDIGIYCLNLVDFVYDSSPVNVKSLGSRLVNSSIDGDVIVCLEYPDKKFANFTAAICSNRPNTAFICGSKGYIQIKSPFHAPTEFELRRNDDKEVTILKYPFETSGNEALFWYPNGYGFVFELEHVRKCLEGNLKESPILPPETSVRLASVTKTILDQF